MNKHYVFEWWKQQRCRTLKEQDIPAAAGQPDPVGMQAPMTDPNMQQTPPQGDDPNIANMMQQNIPQQQPAPEDISQDPDAPDMPEEQPDQDFEQWKKTYFKESISGDSNKMMDMLKQWRDKPDLEPYQWKFVEDNWNIQLLRQNSNIEKASKEIRRNLKDQLDENNPATSVVNNITAVLETETMLNQIFLKLNGYAGLKGDLHRKYIASLLGAVQVGSGGNTEDVIFNERNYSIMVSTRFNARWGDVAIGNWALREDDPQRYLTEPELQRLEGGSPEEREVLRRRIVMESISDLYNTRAFVINVVGEDGTIYHLGWDLSNSLRSAYTTGKLIVRARHHQNSEAMITDDGEIVPFVDIEVVYTKETGEQDPEGMPAVEHKPFMERRDGMLFLSADLETIRDAATSFQGAVFKEVPYRGNPSDLNVMKRCVYSAHELLMRQC